MTIHKVGYIVGSLAGASINRKLAKALIRLAPDNLQFTEIPFRDLPLYSYDYDADYPPVARAFKQAVEAGRTAYEVGLGSPQWTASATSPLTGFLDNAR